MIPGTDKTRFEHIWENWLDNRQACGEIIATWQINRRQYHHLLRKYCPSNNAAVLELGSGTGIDTLLLAREKPGCRFYTLDLSFNSLLVTDKIADYLGLAMRVNRAQADIRNLPYRSHSFSLIFHQELIEHFSGVHDLLLEQKDKLAPNGYLIISVPQTFTVYTIYKKILHLLGKWPWGFETQFSIGDLRRAASAAGFSVIETAGEGYFPRWYDPVFNLYDLGNKIQRRFQPTGILKQWIASYNEWWTAIETKWGHWFQKDIIVVLRPNPGTET